ncbi:MAG: hypothetical protein ABL902_02780 [Gallionella sp.]
MTEAKRITPARFVFDERQPLDERANRIYAWIIFRLARLKIEYGERKGNGMLC